MSTSHTRDARQTTAALLWGSSVLVITGIAFSPAIAGNELTVALDEAQVIVGLPDSIKPGTTEPIVVTVQPAEGKPAPNSVRARVGMPTMGHWIGQEGLHELTGDTVQFTGERCLEGDEPERPGVMCIEPYFEALFPMAGRYRIRVWLDYADGHKVDTAVDINVADGEPLNPTAVK